MESEKIVNDFSILDQSSTVLNYLIEAIERFRYENNLSAEKIKVYIHPVLLRWVEKDARTMYYQQFPIDPLTSLTGVEVREGYEMNFIISAPEFMHINPIKIKVK